MPGWNSSSDTAQFIAHLSGSSCHLGGVVATALVLPDDGDLRLDLLYSELEPTTTDEEAEDELVGDESSSVE